MYLLNYFSLPELPRSPLGLLLILSGKARRKDAHPGHVTRVTGEPFLCVYVFTSTRSRAAAAPMLTLAAVCVFRFRINLDAQRH